MLRGVIVTAATFVTGTYPPAETSYHVSAPVTAFVKSGFAAVNGPSAVAA